MKIKFNEQGNLKNDLVLTITEFQEHFGYNEGRKKKIKSLIETAKTLSSLNVSEMISAAVLLLTNNVLMILMFVSI